MSSYTYIIIYNEAQTQKKMLGKETFDKRTESNVHEQKGVSLMHKTFLLQEKIISAYKTISKF